MNKFKIAELHRHYTVWQDAVQNIETLKMYERNMERGSGPLCGTGAKLAIGAITEVRCPIDSMKAINDALIRAYVDIKQEEEAAIDEIIESIPRVKDKPSVLDYEPNIAGLCRLIHTMADNAKANLDSADLDGLKKILAWKEMSEKLFRNDGFINDVQTE